MPTRATGELQPLADGWAARITIKGRSRKEFFLASCRTEREAVERKTALAELATRLRRAGFVDEIPTLIGAAAKARPGRAWTEICAAVDAICSGKTRAIGGSLCPTIADLADKWTSGKLHAAHPDHVRKKKPSSVARDAGIVKNYIRPTIGDLRVTEIGLDECERVMAAVPARLESASRRHVAQVLSTLLKYAAYPCRHITASPIPRGWLPRLSKPKAMQYVRPTEDAKHLANTSIPLARRLLLGVLRREGLRKEELAELRFRDLDLELGAVRLEENKTDDPRAWALDPGVTEALRRWRACYRPDATDDDYVIAAANGYRYDVHRLAEEQRADLKASGIDRQELHHDGPNRRKLRAHDTRASFITCAMANGRNEAWVQDRTGHTTSAMLNRYRRLARTWGELHLGTWTPLHEAIPELVRVGEHTTRLPDGSPEISRPLGGIGRRSGFKIRNPKGCSGSSPEGATSPPLGVPRSSPGSWPTKWLPATPRCGKLQA